MSLTDKSICCPKFEPALWDNREIVWENKMFIKEEVKCFFHIPIGMGKMMTNAWAKVEKAKAGPEMKDWVMLSFDPSLWKSEHYLAVTKEVPESENVKISGVFLTKVFEGPYQNIGNWYKEMQDLAKSKGKDVKKIYFYYTTCPKCAKKWGKNYVVGFVQV